MHNYTIPNRFTTKTKVGNWYEEAELKDYQFKEYLYKKNEGQNLCLNTQSKLAFSNQPVGLTHNQDGLLRYGDWVMLSNLNTQAALAFNLNESILAEETYAVTTSKVTNPALRNTFQLEAVGQNQSGTVRYGDKVRIVAYFNEKKISLQSIAVSPMRSSKFSRHQQVSITAAQNANSIWVFEHVSPKHRFDSIGQQINVADQIILKHNATSQWLGSQKINYVNEFGAEYETFAKSFLTNNKTQNLYSEKVGHRSAENPLRGQGVQNSWRVIVGN